MVRSRTVAPGRAPGVFQPASQHGTSGSRKVWPLAAFQAFRLRGRPTLASTLETENWPAQGSMRCVGQLSVLRVDVNVFVIEVAGG